MSYPYLQLTHGYGFDCDNGCLDLKCALSADIVRKAFEVELDEVHRGHSKVPEVPDGGG